MNEPLSPPAAKKLLISILASGTVEVSAHAWAEMAADQISIRDVRAVLRGGVVEPAEFSRGSWRYRVRQGRLYVVVTFRSETFTVVVTVWRRK
jgi:hypothetical protein